MQFFPFNLVVGKQAYLAHGIPQNRLKRLTLLQKVDLYLFTKSPQPKDRHYPYTFPANLCIGLHMYLIQWVVFFFLWFLM
jgi:hypothetical protein